MRFTAAALAAVLMMSGGRVRPGRGAAAGHGYRPAAARPAPRRRRPARGAVVPAPVVPPLPLGARTFTAKSGLIFNAVRPDRVVDFEMVIGYLQAAFEKSTDARVREQAKGWRVFKATEPGPNGSVLYVFVIDPAVPGADYGLGRILADAYPDQIREDLGAVYGIAGEWRQPAESDARAAAGDVARAAFVRPGRRRRLPRRVPRRPAGARDQNARLTPRVDAVHDRVQRLAAQLEDAIIEPRPERSEQRDLRPAAGIEAGVRFLALAQASRDRARRRSSRRTACRRPGTASAAGRCPCRS